MLGACSSPTWVSEIPANRVNNRVNALLHASGQALYQSFGNADPAPSRAWPATLDILESLQQLTTASNTQQMAILDLSSIIGTGEYAASSESGRSSPFALADVTFCSAQRSYPAATMSLNDLFVLEPQHRLLTNVARQPEDLPRADRGQRDL